MVILYTHTPISLDDQMYIYSVNTGMCVHIYTINVRKVRFLMVDWDLALELSLDHRHTKATEREATQVRTIPFNFLRIVSVCLSGWMLEFLISCNYGNWNLYQQVTPVQNSWGMMAHNSSLAIL